MGPYSGLLNRRRWIIALRYFLALSCLFPSYLAAKDPATLYMMECQGCHLADGIGGLNSVPMLRNSVARFLTVPGGREYLVQVPGVALSSLSDPDTTAVLNWMLRKFGPLELAVQYAPYTVAEVTRLRRDPLTEIAHNRAALLQQMQPERTTRQ
jgi:hypothetical protein